MRYNMTADYFTVTQDVRDDAALHIDKEFIVRLERYESSVGFRWPHGTYLHGAWQELEDCTENMVLWRVSNGDHGPVKNFVWKRTDPQPLSVAATMAKALDHNVTSDTAASLAMVASVLEGVWSLYTDYPFESFDIFNGCWLFDARYNRDARILFDHEGAPVYLEIDSTVLQEVTEFEPRRGGGNVVAWRTKDSGCKSYLWVQQRAFVGSSSPAAKRFCKRSGVVDLDV